ncbi:aromatic ring-hydroxylating dioxygenase subunit alpha [Crocosphaera sp. XPORK-15E]|uniref:aromatic ring-hydroxylating dioxygenase subunit alpha n=1 Tax=Crocosphaera sp. XPORK-15E TaxID=3110247 RepID=UPI002B211CA1|nr:aromatic ring-hydroxylating dioxygenase subunit alpha [Crocosphaera sp. XPORK-15E]MEA5534387.1 aromatic ring-hydroxylating dioxygenase subunit alpha [Crocosphaera sp. XPORK-15E]
MKTNWKTDELVEHGHYKNQELDLRRIGLNPNFWYPIAQSKDVKKEKTYGVTFGGEPIVLIRTKSNHVFALEDRCIHRQIPLSQGVVCGSKLKCTYHGWTYDETGKLAGVPYLPQGIPIPKGVKSYPCREAYNHIFIFPGVAELAKTVPFPEIENSTNNDYKTMYFSRRVNCHYSFLLENLMDMNHQFLHRRLMGKVKPSLIENSQGDNWVEAKYKFKGEPHPTAHLVLAAGRNKEETATDFDIMTIRTEYPYQTLTVCGPNSSLPALKLWVSYIPVDKEQKINHSFGMLMIRRPKIPGLLTLLWPLMRYFTGEIFAEDKMAVETEQKAYDMQGGDWNQEIFPLLLDVRELLRTKGIPLNQ